MTNQGVCPICQVLDGQPCVRVDMKTRPERPHNHRARAQWKVLCPPPPRREPFKPTPTPESRRRFGQLCRAASSEMCTWLQARKACLQAEDRELLAALTARRAGA